MDSASQHLPTPQAVMHAHSTSSTTISNDPTLVAGSDKRSASTHFPHYAVGDVVLYDFPGYSHDGDLSAWKTYLAVRNDLISPEEEWMYTQS